MDSDKDISVRLQITNLPTAEIFHDLIKSKDLWAIQLLRDKTGI